MRHADHTDHTALRVRDAGVDVPVHAAEWRSPEVDAESAGVLSLIIDGIRARPT